MTTPRRLASRPATVDLAARVEHLLAPHAIPGRREFLTGGYAPTRLPCLGVPVPAVRRVVGQISQALKDEPPRVVLQLALALSKRGSIEGRQVGYEVLARRRDAMALLDRATLERLGRGNDNWASVDAFATSLTGPAWLAGRLSDRDVLAWARSDDPWWRRTAIVSTVPLNLPSRGGRGDTRRTLLVCRAALASEITPLLAKALSWALRSLAPHDPAAVRAFLAEYGDDLPAIVHREVTTKIETRRKTKTRDARDRARERDVERR